MSCFKRTGDFRLATKYCRKQISLEEWCTMTDAQKEKHRNTTFTIPDRQPTATATDDMLQVNFKGSAGRKINQRKRIKAHRTTSVAKQRHTWLLWTLKSWRNRHGVFRCALFFLAMSSSLSIISKLFRLFHFHLNSGYYGKEPLDIICKWYLITRWAPLLGIQNEAI